MYTGITLMYAVCCENVRGNYGNVRGNYVNVRGNYDDCNGIFRAKMRKFEENRRFMARIGGLSEKPKIQKVNFSHSPNHEVVRS